MGLRFLIYGLVGLALEVLFTGTARALKRRDLRLAGHSYLWMLPIYGTGGLGLEAIYRVLSTSHAAWYGRGLAYMLAIFAIEYLSGALLRKALGRCPWDYGHRGLNLHGLVRLDYAPAWFACGLIFERIHDILGQVS